MPTIAINADVGAMGGKASQEFTVPHPQGEDLFIACQNCDYAANVVAIATMFMGGPVKGTMQSGVSYALQADPQRYADTVNSQLDTTQKLFTAALLKAKQ